ncbi:MAG: toll/interleukin-1 receptor domain-containing protein, partial [Anaerolineae bacterium]|nr:toll/interleukin-1 receptor domain-containing protein [Anaerolineae bacterium]
MPTLFISYKRNTTAVAPLMEKLRDAHYRLWFDRDEIHLGDDDWQARIDQGIRVSDAVILNITPAACASEPVRYEVRKARELGMTIFPIALEKITDYDAAIRDLGLADKQHIEDFTEVPQWDEQIKRLLRDLEAQGLRVTRHDLRQERDRNNPNYVLHQHYLRRLVERIGMLNLA